MKKLNIKTKKEKNFPPKADQPRADRDKKKDELKKELAILEEKKRLIKFKAEGSRSKNVKEYAALRKQVARILTAINSPA